MDKLLISFFLLLCASASASFLANEDWQKAVITVEDAQRLQFFQSLYEKASSQKAPLGKIPKVFHVIWLGPHPFPSECLFALKSWRQAHPDAKMKWWSDQSFSPPLADMQVCPFESFPLGECEEIYFSAQQYEERSMILSYAILLSEGGVCIDPGIECVASLDVLLDSHDFFCGLEVPGVSIRSSSINPSCHLIAATKAHPILARAKEWMLTHWQEYEQLLPGNEELEIDCRIQHRTSHALSVGIERGADLEGSKDAVFPPHFFNVSKKEARYAATGPDVLFGSRRQQAQTKEKMEDAFNAIRKQLRLSIILICILAALNLFLGAMVIYLYRKRK